LYSHDKNSGTIQTGTFDNIYSTCLESLNVSNRNDPNEYDLVFTVDTENHGLLESCGHIPKSCADDCFFGVLINDLKQYQPSSTTVSMTSTTNNLTDDGKSQKD
jgi:hypothetical protein